MNQTESSQIRTIFYCFYEIGSAEANIEIDVITGCLRYDRGGFDQLNFTVFTVSIPSI